MKSGPIIDARTDSTGSPQVTWPIVAAVPLAFAAAYLVTPPLARLDDSYIALHSARVVLSGHDPIFNVPALVGATSPAFVALVAVTLATGLFSGDTALRLANAAGIVAYAAAVWQLGSVLNLSTLKKMALLAAAIASGVVLTNLTNGLETGWAMAVLVFAVAHAHARRLKPVAFAAGLLPFLRPDLAPATLAVLWYAARKRPRSEQLIALTVVVAAAAPWLIWTRVNTGEWIGQTMRAKMAFFYLERCVPWVPKVMTTLRYLVVFLVQLLPLSGGLLFLPRDRLGRLGVLAIAATLTVYLVVFPTAFVIGQFRYLCAIVVPWMCLGAASGLRQMSTGVAVTVVAAGLAARLAVLGGGGIGYTSYEMKATAQWIDDHVPADGILLVHDAGGVSEFAHRRAIDVVGLKTPSSLDEHMRWTWPTCGADRHVAMAHIAAASGASYFVAITGWSEYLGAELQREGYVLTPVRHPPEAGGYTVYRLQSPIPK